MPRPFTPKPKYAERDAKLIEDVSGDDVYLVLRDVSIDVIEELDPGNMTIRKSPGPGARFSFFRVKGNPPAGLKKVSVDYYIPSNKRED